MFLYGVLQNTAYVSNSFTQLRDILRYSCRDSIVQGIHYIYAIHCAIHARAHWFKVSTIFMPYIVLFMQGLNISKVFTTFIDISVHNV